MTEKEIIETAITLLKLELDNFAHAGCDFKILDYFENAVKKVRSVIGESNVIYKDGLNNVIYKEGSLGHIYLGVMHKDKVLNLIEELKIPQDAAVSRENYCAIYSKFLDSNK